MSENDKKHKKNKKSKNLVGMTMVDEQEKIESRTRTVEDAENAWERSFKDDQPTIVENIHEEKKTVGSWVTIEDRSKQPRFDNSPPRRPTRRHDDGGSDASPPRRPTGVSSKDAGLRRRSPSPARREPGRDSDTNDDSPPRRPTRRHDDGGSDASPPRRPTGVSSKDAGLRRRSPSPARREPRDNKLKTNETIISRSDHRHIRQKVAKTASGHTAGIQSSSAFAEKEKELKRKRDEDLASMDATSNSGAGAETIYRDKRGRKLDMLNEFMRQEAINQGKVRVACFFELIHCL